MSSNRSRALLAEAVNGQKDRSPSSCSSLKDSYFIVEDMANTFGVRLGGQDRVALYGRTLSPTTMHAI